MSYDPIAKSYLKVLTEQQLPLNFDAPTESRMISVDGMLKHRYNSANQPIHHTDEGIKNFHRWFGNSTTVDEQGRPKVFYHGTTATENDSGDTAVTHFNPYYNLKSKQLYGAGVYTTENPDIASEYSSAYRDHAKNDQPNVLSLYVKAEHPLDIDAPIQKSLIHLQKIKGAKTPTGKLKQYIDDYARAGVLPLLNHVSRAYEDETGRYADFDKYQDYAKNTAIDAIHEKVRLGELKTGKDLFNLHAKTYYRGLNETGTHNASTRALRMLGFDSIKHIGGRNLGTIDHPVVIALDSANVKSALGNRGTFNPNRNELSESSEHPMIDVDGEMKHRHNSEGKPIHHTDEGIKSFHRWFGNSTTVDEQGRPNVFYHGTHHDFDEFAENQRGLHFVSTSPKWTSKFIKGSSGNFDDGQNILPVYVKANNPFDYQNKKHVNFLATKASLGNLAIQQIRSGSWSRIEDRTTMNHIKNNFDGVYVKEDGVKNLAVFHPHQIKSALGNSGKFVHPTKITESVDHPMIDVDGEMKHRHNSEGKPIHPSDEGIRNFHRWANGTELKDSIGRPQLMYHGTSKDVDFSEFKVPKNGVWLTTNKESASSYANQNDSMDMKYDPDTRRYVDVNTAGRVIPLYVKGNSTYTMTEDDHKKINTDNYRRSQSIMFDNLRFKNHDVVSHGGGTYTVIGGKHQFKSAMGNKGVFSSKKNKIHEAYLNVR